MKNNKHDVRFMGKVKDENGNPLYHFEAIFGGKAFGDYLFYLNPEGEFVRGNKAFVELPPENTEFQQELVATAQQKLKELGIL